MNKSTISIRTLFFVLFPIVILSACGSGASSTNAGGVGSNSGSTGLIIFGRVDPSFTSSNTCESGQTDTVRLFVTIQDPNLGLTALTSQGVTFDMYTLDYQAVNQGGAIPLAPRSRTLTFPVPLNGNTEATASTTIVLVDLETKTEYARRDSGSVNTYNVRITYHGRDFISNSPVTLVVDTQMEIGAFCSEEEETTEEEA